MHMMHVINVDGTIDSTVNKEHTTLEEVQKLVGGYIETVPYFTKWEGMKCQAYVDEEGKLKGYKPNITATALWYDNQTDVRGDILVGPVVILTGKAMLD